MYEKCMKYIKLNAAANIAHIFDYTTAIWM